jgi:hypothetical protein
MTNTNWNQEQAAGELAMRQFEDEDEADQMLCDELRKVLKTKIPGPGFEAAIMAAVAKWAGAQE